MDMAYHPQTKDTIFLLSQSYMPAQDIHILVNPNDEMISPWYSIHSGAEIITPEWTFTWDDLKEF
jgi:5-keto 4-deoxyuronate isomerase